VTLHHAPGTATDLRANERETAGVWSNVGRE